MDNIKVTETIKNIGVNDKNITLFESQYVVPHGMAYNSYLIQDEKNVIIDTVDKVVTEKWYENINNNLNGENIDYLIVSHLEPDHGYNIKSLSDKYPDMKIIGNSMTFKFIKQFFSINNIEERAIIVKEGDTLNIGKHTLKFIMAPMVHWPEVMVTYEETEKILFSADAFGKFGTLDVDENWTCEARRYYFGIVGKYGMQVQNLLKKLSNIDVKQICPLHGPVLKDNLEYYINKYDIWSSYKSEDEGILIAYASIHGNTEEAVKKLEKMLENKGNKKVILRNLVTEDLFEVVEDAFRYDKMVIAASSYNAEIFPPMEHFLNALKSRNYQNRKVGIIENGTWAPSAAKCMLDIISKMKDIEVYKNIITIKSKLDEDNIKEFERLVDELYK